LLNQVGIQTPLRHSCTETGCWPGCQDATQVTGVTWEPLTGRSSGFWCYMVGINWHPFSVCHDQHLNRRVATQEAYFHKWVSITGHNTVHDLTHERAGSSEASFGVARPHTFMRSIFPRSSSSSRFYNTPTELSERQSHTHTYINTQTINDTHM